MLRSVNPMSVLVEEMLPAYAADARDLVARILELANEREEEIPIQDGFDLYSELVEIRRVHAEALPRSVQQHLFKSKALNVM